MFEHMRAMAVNLHAVAINCQILSLASDFDQTTDGYTLSGETVIERIDRGVTELCSYIELFNKERAE